MEFNLNKLLTERKFLVRISDDEVLQRYSDEIMEHADKYEEQIKWMEQKVEKLNEDTSAKLDPLIEKLLARLVEMGLCPKDMKSNDEGIAEIQCDHKEGVVYKLIKKELWDERG